MAKCEHDVDNLNHMCLITGQACGHVGKIKECPILNKSAKNAEEEKKKA